MAGIVKHEKVLHGRDEDALVRVAKAKGARTWRLEVTVGSDDGRVFKGPAPTTRYYQTLRGAEGGYRRIGTVDQAVAFVMSHGRRSNPEELLAYIGRDPKRGAVLEGSWLRYKDTGQRVSKGTVIRDWWRGVRVRGEQEADELEEAGYTVERGRRSNGGTMARRRKNMRYRGQPDMPEVGLRRVPGTGSFAVTATRDDVDDFADQWPGSGFPSKGFTAEFEANGDLIDLSGWAYNFDGDQAALSALIDDMRDYGLEQRDRRGNPAGRKIESKAQWRKLAAMMTRGEISKKDFDDMVAASKPFDRLPARKGRKSKRRKSTRRR